MDNPVRGMMVGLKLPAPEEYLPCFDGWYSPILYVTNIPGRILVCSHVRTEIPHLQNRPFYVESRYFYESPMPRRELPKPGPGFVLPYDAYPVPGGLYNL